MAVIFRHLNILLDLNLCNLKKKLDKHLSHVHQLYTANI